MTTYDLIVIGSGAAATSAVFKCVEKGWKVAVIDHKPLGGTCALRGCDPKKVMVGVTGSLEATNRLQGNGVSMKDGKIEWPELIAFKRTFTEPMSRAIGDSLSGSGVDTYNGHAVFISESEVTVNGASLTGKKFLIASGIRATDPGFPGSEYLVDNEGFMDLPELPEHIVFVGGGYISVEFAGIVQKAGSKATIVQSHDTILRGFDRGVVEKVTDALERSGIRVLTNTTVKGIEKIKGRFRISVNREGKEEFLDSDLVVHGAGRTFDPDMGLQAADVKWSRNGVRVNEFLQSVSNPRVYAAGDSADTGKYKLTPVANLEGSVAASNLLTGNNQKPDYAGIPTVVFASPPLSMVGLTEEEARQKGIHLKVKEGGLSTWYNSRRRGIRDGYYKVLTDKESGMVIGAHIFAENSEETINIFSLAIRENISAERLISAPYTYPSDINDIRYMLE